jgi:hypothetical protein
MSRGAVKHNKIYIPEPGLHRTSIVGKAILVALYGFYFGQVG